MLFKVTNESKGPRFVVTKRGRTVVLPGDKNAKRVDLEPEVARQYAAAKDRGKNKGSFVLEAVDDDGRAELQKPPVQRDRNPRRLPPDARRPQQPEASAQSPYDEMMQGDTIAEEEDGKYDAKQELLSRADNMTIENLRAEARMVLGSDWPDNGDRLNKAGVKRLLED